MNCNYECEKCVLGVHDKCESPKTKCHVTYGGFENSC